MAYYSRLLFIRNFLIFLGRNRTEAALLGVNPALSSLSSLPHREPDDRPLRIVSYSLIIIFPHRLLLSSACCTLPRLPKAPPIGKSVNGFDQECFKSS